MLSADLSCFWIDFDKKFFFKDKILNALWRLVNYHNYIFLTQKMKNKKHEFLWGATELKKFTIFSRKMPMTVNSK